MADVVEIWTDTGERIERDFTADELKQRKLDEKAADERAAAEARQVETRSAAVAHAKKLGFTDEMIAVMYPGLAAE